MTDPEYRFVLTGITPILFHNNDVEAQDRIKEWQKDPDNKQFSKKGDDRSPAWLWQSYLHSDGQHVAIPQDVIMKMLGKAGAKVPTGKGTETFKSMSQSGIVPATEFFKFTTGEHQVKLSDIYALRDQPFSVQAQEVKRLGFQLFVKPVRVKSSSHVRVRPRFNTWGVEGVVTITEPAITPAILERFFQIGGKYCGLLDWRPNAKESPGPYGTFSAEVTPLILPKRKSA